MVVWKVSHGIHLLSTLNINKVIVTFNYSYCTHYHSGYVSEGEDETETSVR